MEASRDFFLRLFDVGEYVGLGRGVQDSRSGALANDVQADVFPFFVINPLRPGSPRRDQNVSVYRNFLIECDTLPLDEQLHRIRDLGMPFTSCVYSGNKSLHFIVSLASALPSRQEYDRLARRLLQAVPWADKTTKNPSRFSRTPGHQRVDTERLQRLEWLGSRVDTALLLDWLRLVEPKQGVEACQRNGMPMPLRANPPSTSSGVSAQTIELVLRGAIPGTRNDRLFRAACDLRRNGMSEDEALAFLDPARDRLIVADFPEAEFRQAIRSAFSYREEIELEDGL